MESDFVVILVALAALSVLLMTRVCRDSERIALNTSQRFLKLIGPGLFLRLPTQLSPYEYTRVRIGDKGRYIGNGWAKIGGQNLPVQQVENVDVDSSLRVKDFVNQEIFVETDSENALEP